MTPSANSPTATRRVSNCSSGPSVASAVAVVNIFMFEAIWNGREAPLENSVAPVTGSPTQAPPLPPLRRRWRASPLRSLAPETAVCAWGPLSTIGVSKARSGAEAVAEGACASASTPERASAAPARRSLIGGRMVTAETKTREAGQGSGGVGGPCGWYNRPG